MKKVLFVMNTLSRAGAENALLELLRKVDKSDTKISLLVLTGMGELKKELPPEIMLLNENYSEASVLSKEGRRILRGRVWSALFWHGGIFRRFGYLTRHFFRMVCRGRLLLDKLFWRVLADDAPRLEEEYDIAVAYIEGGSTYYVADYVKAKHKYAFVHIAYKDAGYERSLDGDAYASFEKIIAVSKEVEGQFASVYPEYADKLTVNENILDVSSIEKKACESLPFSLPEDELVLLTVGRLTEQKALEVSVEACALLKANGLRFRWYVVGEGPKRKKLEKLIREKEVADCFILAGATDNPYPFMKRCDLYVHASRYEGKSIALTEAKLLGCAVIVSDTEGNRGQIEDGADGLFCALTPESICGKITELAADGGARKKLGETARERTLQNLRQTNAVSLSLPGGESDEEK